MGAGGELVEGADDQASPVVDACVAQTDTSVADSAGKLASTLTAVVEDISEALNIIETNATETISTRCDVIVKAALHSGWIVSPELSDEQIDNMRPWLVQWIAGEIITLYNEATSIPKN